MSYGTPPGPAVQSDGAPEDLPVIVHELVGSLLWHNAMLGCLLQELEELRSERRDDDERRRAEHYQINRRLDLVIGQFNDVFPDEVMARAAFHAVNPGREFPDDAKARRSRKRRALAAKKGGRRGGNRNRLPSVEA